MDQDSLPSQRADVGMESISVQLKQILGTMPQAAADDDRSTERAESRRQAQLLRESGIPERYRCARLTDLRASPGNQAAFRRATALESFENVPDRGICITGGPGCGKTHMACGIATVWISAGRTVRFWRTSNFLRDVKAGYSHDRGDERKLFRQAAKSELLILDDLGTEGGSEWAQGILLDLLDECWNRRSLLIVTTNVPTAEFDRAFDPRISSRLAALCHMVQIKDRDHRVMSRNREN
jgi:DNA replication protein DnaC